MSRPDHFALLIGAMKSGTTSLFRYLAQHPAVAPSHPKEPGYFAFPRVRARGDAWYLGLWDWDPAHHRVALEGSPYYTKLPDLPGVPDAVQAFAQRQGADVRLIYIMRDPIARMESHFRHVAQIYPGRMLLRRRAVYAQALAYSSYARQIGPWVERFGRARVLLLVFEELEREPAAVVARTCRFLGIDPAIHFARLDERHNVSARRQAAYLLLRSQPLVRALWGLLPAHSRERLRSTIRPFTQRRRPYLDARERAHALEQLRPELATLTEQYGVDLSSWTLP